MPKKRGRPRNKQNKAKKARGSPKKAVVTRARTRANAASAASATITTPVAPVVQQYSSDKPFITPVSYDSGSTPVFRPVESVPHDAKFQLPLLQQHYEYK